MDDFGRPDASHHWKAIAKNISARPFRQIQVCNTYIFCYGGGGYETDQSEDSIGIATGMCFCRDEADLFQRSVGFADDHRRWVCIRKRII